MVRANNMVHTNYDKLVHASNVYRRGHFKNYILQYFFDANRVISKVIQRGTKPWV